jgi:DNA invertase Pin-like site-specific DNA recombinase
MEYGYVRISTRKQSIDRQIRNIRTVCPSVIIVQEIYTGTTTDRPEWGKLEKRLHNGDSIYFDSVSRMSRNAEEGYLLYQELFDKGINLYFLKEPHINTNTYRKSLESNIPQTGTSVDILLDGVRKYLMLLAKEQIRIAFEQAEKEVLDLRQRTKEGIETARLNGKQIGTVPGSKLRVKKKEPAMVAIRKYNREFEGVLNDTETMKLIGLSRNTYYKYKREVKNNYYE